MTTKAEIVVAGDTRAAMSAIQRGVIDPLEDVSELLEQIGDQRDTAQLERSMRDAQRRTEDAKDEIRDLRDELNRTGRAGKSAGDDIADGAKHAENSMSRVRDGAQEVQQEIGQNLGEAVSSIRGDMSDLAQVGQDTLGGLAATLAGTGPAGLVGAALLAAGAIGAGGITAALEDAEERRKMLEDRANDLAQAYIDAGSEVASAMYIAGETASILTDPERKKDAKELAEVLGVDLPTAARALAGDSNALAVANKIAKDSEQERLDLMRESANYMSGDYTQADKARLDQLQAQRVRVDELNASNASASETFRTQQQVLEGLINDADSATKEVDELGNELYTLPDGTQILIDADTKQATTDVDKFKGDLDGVPETVTSRVKVDLDDSAVRNYRPPVIKLPGEIYMRPGSSVRWQ